MMWLRQAVGYGEPEQPRVSPIENNPVGWSSIYPPQVVTNPDPNVSPVVSRSTMTPQALWGALLSGNKKNVTAAELPALEQKANTMVDYGMAVAGATQPIRAFHGSPHTFDRFDLSKIGTGEGAQAYGHGLYFAGNEGIARHYRDALTSGADNWTVNGRRLGDLYVSAAPGARLDYEIGIAARQGRSPQEAIDYVLAQRQSQLTSKRVMPEDVPFLREDIATLQALKAKPPVIENNPGSMYEVNLRTSPERLLDWDKPLSAQPGARNAIANAYENRGMFEKANAVSGGAADAWNGGKIIESVGMQNRPAFTQQLRDAGLDGIQYLDAGSRTAGDGSRNYVMFRDDIIDILKRYGLFGLGMMGAAGAQGGKEQ